MKVRNDFHFLTTCAVVAVLLTIGLGALFKLMRGYETVEAALQVSTEQLERLINRNPYPSQENILLLEKRLSELREKHDSLLAHLREGQTERYTVDPAEFPWVLERTIRRLQALAASSNLRLPDAFAFGFKTYSTEGQLPAPEVVPRLLLQLHHVETFCQQLFDCGITAIDTIQREPFDELTGGARNRARLRKDWREDHRLPEDREASGLYTSEHYVLNLIAKEHAFRALLNRLASSKPCTVVTRINTSNLNLYGEVGSSLNQGGSRRPASGDVMDSSLALEANEEGKPRNIRATIAFDIYHFKAREEIRSL